MSPASELSRTFKLATIWLLIATALFLGFLWWERQSRATSFHAVGDVVEIRRAADGHYHWPGRIGGRAVDFLVDTGATGIAIPAALARDLGLPGEGSVQSRTAGGVVTGSIVRADVELRGGVSLRNARMTALPDLEQPMLGMAVLGRLPWQQRDRVLTVDLRGGQGGDGAPPRGGTTPARD